MPVALREGLAACRDSGEARQRRLIRIQGFHPRFRKQVELLARRSAAIEDLAESFPGLLFALATDYATAAARDHAIRLVESGASLREAAAALGLPRWLKRLPAVAYREPLSDIPDSRGFVQRATALMPDGATESRVWLWGLLYGARYCGEEYALWAAGWLARNAPIFSLPYGEDTFRYLTAWAWASTHRESALARLIGRPWTSGIGLRRALDDLSTWRLRIDLDVCLTERRGNRWLPAGSALGFEFVPLDSAEAFIEEARALDNCLDIYAAKLRLNRSSIYSIRRGGQRIGVVEIGPHPEDAARPALLQLRTRRNRRADPELWQAAYTWLGATRAGRRAPRLEPPPSWSREVARHIWREYLDWQAERGKDSRMQALVLGETTAGSSAAAGRRGAGIGRRPGPSPPRAPASLTVASGKRSS
ncbi:MAG: hypothetical protein AB1749_06235 [Pseudomonadota bacterium]